jgi:flagellar hook-basal body complex protein FliE
MGPIRTEGFALPVSAPQGTREAKGFGDVIKQAVQNVDAQQAAADNEAQKVARGDGNLHELSLALEKADVSMRVAMKVRNKLVDAYNEVMRMSL